MMSRRGIMGNLMVALPVILINVVAIILFVAMTGTLLVLKAPEQARASSLPFDALQQQSHVFSDLFLYDRVVLNTSLLTPDLLMYVPSEFRGAVSRNEPLRVRDALYVVTATFAHGRTDLPLPFRVSFFGSFERVLSRYASCGEQPVFVLALPPSSGLGSSSDWQILYDYPRLSWVRGDVLPHSLFVNGRLEDTYPFNEQSMHDGYYHDYESVKGASMAFKGEVSC